MLIHQPTAGDTSQSNKKGAQKSSSADRLTPNAKASAIARTGATHISIKKSASVRRALRLAYDRICQSNKPRRVNSIRTPERRIASRQINMSYGKKTNVSKASTIERPEDLPVRVRCASQ